MHKNAKWIELTAVPRKYENAPVSPEFRRVFRLEKMPEQAVLRITGMGFFDARINGMPVTENLLTPPFTAYDKRVYFEEYDVTELLSPGNNEIRVCLGAGWYSGGEGDAWEFEHAPWHACLKMIASLSADGECLLVTDRSWQGRVSNTVFALLREGETCDASAPEEPWAPVQISRGAGGVPEKYDGPAIRVENVLEPVQMIPTQTGVLYDFGVNLSGNCEITVSGPRGSRVKLVYAERIFDNGEPDTRNISCLTRSQRFQTDEYILAGTGEETWHSLFNYNGFRYVMASGDATILAVRARCFHTELPQKGGFRCDNDVLNAIQDAILRSTKTNFHHMPTDCPHREKNGWTGDAQLSAEQALFNLDMLPAYRKWLRDFRDVQRPNGMLPGIIPTGGWGFQWGNGVTWDCACVIIPWESYMATGDESILLENFSMMEKYVDYMASLAEDHISTIGLGDWCAARDAKPMNTNALLTAVSIRVYRLMEKICSVTGRGCPEKYRCLADETVRAFRKYFLGEIPEDSPFGPVQDSQTFLAMLLWHDLAEDCEEVTARLVREVEAADGHILCGIFGAKFILDALTDNGRFDLAYEMATKTTYPGWFHMLSNGSGTLWEDWEGTSSLNHHMYSPIGAWFYRGIAGIHIVEPGYRRVRICPHVPENMGYFHAWHDAPMGRLEVLWKDGKLTVTAPEEMAVEMICDLPWNLVRTKTV